MAKPSNKQAVLKETKQVGKFSLIGIINTLIDFVIYNIGISVFGLAVIAANLVSTTVAMSFSFVANKNFVFGSKQKQVLRQALLFLIITAFGLYALQNGVIYILKYSWHWPLDLAYDIVKAVGLQSISQEFVVNNGAKIIGTVFSFVWNYILYKKYVFKS